MKLPRDLSGEKVAKLLARHYEYRVTRTKGSHMVATLKTAADKRHSVTVPRHREVHIGTLDAIITDVARFLGKSKSEVRESLFG